MKSVYLLLLLSLLVTSSFCQKKTIDEFFCNNWFSIKALDGKNCQISNNGKFVAYKYGNDNNESKIILKHRNGDILDTFINPLTSSFTEDSRKFITLISGDSLIITSLQREKKEIIDGVASYVLPINDSGKWIALKFKNSNKILIKNLDNNISFTFQDIIDFWFNKTGSVIIANTKDGLLWKDLEKQKEFLIPNSKNVIRLEFDETGNYISFLSKADKGNIIFLYSPSMDQPLPLIDNTTVDPNNNYEIGDGLLEFSKNGNGIHFLLKKRSTLFNKNETEIGTGVNIWAYNDKVLAETKAIRNRESSNKLYRCFYNIRTSKPIQLENDSLLIEFSEIGNQYALVRSNISFNEFYWNNDSLGLYLISLNDGTKTKLFKSIYPAYKSAQLSPDEKYVIWFDSHLKHYFSYEIKTNTIRNVSSLIKESLSLSYRGDADKPRDSQYPYGITSWFIDESSIVVYDRWDLWKLDLSGKKPPVNITKSYGKANNIMFRLLDTNFKNNKDKTAYIYGFNYSTKENGFWKINLGENSEPIKLYMGPYSFYFQTTATLTGVNGSNDPMDENFKPIKAKYSNEFVVRRMSVSEEPNLYSTTDFTSFTPVTNLHQNKNVNWMRSKLITWSLSDGQLCNGILHLPEDFDSTKKYPVIFNYYERRSDGLYVFRKPQLSANNINIPWFVNHGYLIFEPDIYYKTGQTSTSILDAIISGAKELSSLSYIDTSKMGLQGHSFGGYETNVIISGSNIFAAACEMAGPTDLISEYGSLRPNGSNNQSSADIGQRNLGVFPWDHPQIFIDNSPIFHLRKINTPLLIVHNKNDGSISFNQAIELFLGMRRIKKHVWMLQYENEGHVLLELKNKIDYTKKVEEFFDYYLKKKMLPTWMTN